MSYLGKTPSQAVRSRYYFTATGGETSLSGSDDNSNTLTFTDGNYVDVSLNGVALVAGTDYNTTTANTIGGLVALVASDVVEVVVYDTFSVFGGNINADLNLKDNAKINFGAGNDLQVYHTGSTSYIWEQGTGDLRIRGSQVRIEDDDGSTIALFKEDAGVELRHDGTVKLESTSTGVSIPTGQSYAIVSDTDVAINRPTTNTLGIKTGNTQRMRIANGGDISFYADNGTTQGLFWDASTQRLGLGTTSPSSIFHTEENTTSASIVRHKNTSNTSGAHSRLIIQNGGTSGGDALINLDTQASGSRFTLGVDRSASKFVIANADKGSFDGSNEAFVITSGGNVGIGTSPARQFHLHDASGDNNLHITNSTTGETATDGFSLVSQSSTNDVLLNQRETANMRFLTGNSERMRIDSSGKVGIGTTAPVQVLDVHNGNIAVTSADTYQTAVNIDNTDTGGAHWGLHSTGSNNTAGEFRIYDYDNNVERMRIDSSGNVGIGTNSPSALLEVDGNAIAKTNTDTSNTGSVTLDFGANQNFVLTLTGNVTLANPTTEQVGQSGFITFIQDSTGGRTVSLGTDYETAGGAGLTLSSTASTTDIVPYVVVASGRILLGAPQLAFS